MPFRQRVKRALGRNSISDGSSLKATKTADSAKSNGTDDSTPKPKYRGRVDPAHKAVLESFSFDQDAGARRDSYQSQYSPFGSKLPSRNHSIDGTEAWGLHLDPRMRHLNQVRAKTGMSGAVMENDDDAGDDATNFGNPSISEPSSSVPSEDSSNEGQDDNEGLHKVFSRDHPQFTEADVTNALMKSMSKRSRD